MYVHAYCIVLEHSKYPTLHDFRQPSLRVMVPVISLRGKKKSISERIRLRHSLLRCMPAHTASSRQSLNMGFPCMSMFPGFNPI